MKKKLLHLSQVGSTPSIKTFGDEDLRVLRDIRGELNIEQYKFVKDISKQPIREYRSQIMKEYWINPENRERQSRLMKEYWSYVKKAYRNEKGLPMTNAELRTPLENLERMCRRFGYKSFLMELIEGI